MPNQPANTYIAPPSVPGSSGYAQPVPPSQGMIPPGLPAALASIPDDQKVSVERNTPCIRECLFVFLKGLLLLPGSHHAGNLDESGGDISIAVH